MGVALARDETIKKATEKADRIVKKMTISF